MKTMLVHAVILMAFVNAAPAAASSDAYNIRSFGAKPDGRTLCTEAIQNAVDQCAKDGGGIVYFLAGRWLTGTVYLASNVTVELENGCTVLGAADKSQYGRPRQLTDAQGEQYSTWALFAGKGLRSIAIRGRGTIDGQGGHFKYKEGARPKNLYFEDCRDVLIEGVQLRNAGSWMQQYRNCERLTIRDIAVFNHVSYNNDGLNIDSCRGVVIRNCRPPDVTRVFLSLAGPHSKAISLHGNDFAGVSTVSDCAPDTLQSVLALWSNRTSEHR